MRTGSSSVPPLPASVAVQSVWDGCGIVALVMDADMRIVDANPYARALLRADAVGSAAQDVFVHLGPDVRLADLAAENGGRCSMSLHTVAGMPETLLFQFFETGEGGGIAIGCLDVQEQQKLRNEVLSLNAEMAMRVFR